MATTVSDIINRAFFESGIFGQGQTPTGQDTQIALSILREMTAQWNRKRYLMFCLTDTALTSTGALFYTVGPGGDFNIPRPDKLEDGNFIRQTTTGNNPVDYSLYLINSREDYNRITVKNIGNFGSSVYYDPQYPLGKAYFWPVPASSMYELHILTKTPLTNFTSLGQPLNLPYEYNAALNYNLQVRLREAYDLLPREVTIALAAEALNVLRESNSQIQTLRMPKAVTGRGWYNIWSDGN